MKMKATNVKLIIEIEKMWTLTSCQMLALTQILAVSVWCGTPLKKTLHPYCYPETWIFMKKIQVAYGQRHANSVH